ncbi:gamma-glutamyltransferase [Amycolatopsis sp. NPDC051372]|uniref:gamma-glutamyltransferase family protein n=1 Tax=Amycolatopsis sp. NPDC051372 TaxID=3155669 RepID=UPI00342BF1AB
MDNTDTTFLTRPDLLGDVGMVASTHWLASATGMSVLEQGGNAADAAVAAGFVMQVVEPHLNGPAGEVPILLFDPAAGDVRCVAGQGPMPAGADIDTMTGLGLDLMPGTGLLSATVPGAFAAWLTLFERWGTWELADVLTPAIHYAEHGWPALEGTAEAIAPVVELFTEHWRASAEIWLPGGQVPRAGARMTNPLLAATWQRLLRESAVDGGTREARIERARRVFYEGFVAEAIAAHAATPAMDSTGRPNAGVLAGDDLARWVCPVEDTASLVYRGYTVHKTGPWGQGPVFLQQLALLRELGVDGIPFLSAEYIHTIVECGKLAFADREAWYGDPDGADVPLNDLLSTAYTVERSALVTPDASNGLRPGSPGGREPRLPAMLRGNHERTGTAVGSGEPTAGDFAAGTGTPTLGDSRTDPVVERTGVARGDTCHLDVVDASGMAVSATPSGGWLHSSPAIPGLGFALGTRGQMTWLEPGLASSLRPGRRPRTTLTPSLAVRDGRPFLAFGTPGGDQQDQWSLLFFLAHVDHGLGLQAATDAPMFHSMHHPGSFWPRRARERVIVAESRIPESTIADLTRRGHTVERAEAWSLGRVSAAGVDPETGFLRAAATARGAQGYAVGR